MKDDTLFDLFISELRDSGIKLKDIVFNSGIYGIAEYFEHWLYQNSLIKGEMIDTLIEKRNQRQNQQINPPKE